jgi:hypothetical protein
MTVGALSLIASGSPALARRSRTSWTSVPLRPIRGSAGESTRLFELFKGAQWTLLGYEVQRDVVPPHPGLHIHTFGPSGDVIDEGGHFRNAYAVASGDWVLVRPDGYVGAVVSSSEIGGLERYLRDVGLQRGRF